MKLQSSAAALFSAENLTTELDLPAGPLRVVNDVALSVRRGEALGIVGESGAGKTMLALSLIGHPPPPHARLIAGRVHYQNIDILRSLDSRDIIGKKIGVIFENAGASLDPCYKIGHQIAETITAHENETFEAARERAIELLGLVGLPDPASAFNAYPHQFSGGMKQRAGIAISLACNPEILIADNPTNALDVTIQSQIVRLIQDLRKRLGLTLIWITHNLGLVAQLCDRVAIIYAGQIVELGPVDQVIHEPSHPYTRSLMQISKMVGKSERMEPLSGTQPKVHGPLKACVFAERCPIVQDSCHDSAVALRKVTGDSHEARCLFPLTGGKAA